MRNYQRKKDNPYKLPHNVYMQTLYMVKDYNRLKKESNELRFLEEDPFEQMAEESELRLRRIDLQLQAVDQALLQIPEEYRRGVWDNIVEAAPYPYIADSSTWSRWRQRFLYYIAKHAHGA